MEEKMNRNEPSEIILLNAAKAIDEIDKTIDHLQKTKEALLSSDKNLRIANDKIDAITIKKLTNNSKSIRDMFDKLKEQKTITDKDDNGNEQNDVSVTD